MDTKKLSHYIMLVLLIGLFVLPCVGIKTQSLFTASPTAAASEPIVSKRVQPNDFVYKGAFRLPGSDERPRTFAYGGNAMTFNPDGDPSNRDAYPGSLFIMGHERIAYGDLPNGNQVAEVSIPVPTTSSNSVNLPKAQFIQGFHDVTAGYFTQVEEIPKVGMQYLNHPATGPKIHLAWGQHLQSERIATHAWFNATLAKPNLQGVWFIGKQDLYSVNGYMFDIPKAWADTHVGGRYLATGRFRDGGQGGMGPTLFAYRPWLPDGSAPPSGTNLSEITLLLYENAYNTDKIVRCLRGYQHADEWEGGAWITTPSGKSAVLFTGNKATGAKNWYGYLHPNNPEKPCVDRASVGQFRVCLTADGRDCPPEDLTGCTTHASQRGWWASRFDAQFILYDPADLGRVAAGTMKPWEPQPYASVSIEKHLYLNPTGIEKDMIGSGSQRRYKIGPAAYDRTNGILYVLEWFADGSKPVVHVWRIF